MGPKERREREREETRARIVDAAREMFATEGFEAVTMRRIAERIEYSPTAIYFHFKDKDALFRELCDTDFRQLAHQFASIAEIADPIDRLRKTGHAFASFGMENPGHYRLMFMTPHPPINKEDLQIERGNPEEDAYAFLKAVVAQAVAEGRFRPELTDADLLAQTVWAGVHGAISLHIAKCNDDWVDWRPFADRLHLMVETLINGLVKE